MTNWHGMMLLVSEWSLKSPLHNATIVSVLRALADSLFHNFLCVRIQEFSAQKKAFRDNLLNNPTACHASKKLSDNKSGCHFLVMHKN